MRRALILIGAAVAALSTTGLAIATLKPSGSEAVSATFAAAKERAETRMCTGPDGTYEITHGRYAGEADSSNEALDGPIVLHVKSVYNTTEKIGWVEGWLRVRKEGEDDRRSTARFWATLGDGGAVEGFAHGRVGWRYAALFGNVSATFSPASGFTNGKIGGGGGNNAAVLVGRPCSGRQGIAVRLSVKGQVEALSAAEIRVKPRDGSASQSCAIVQGRSPSTSGVSTGSNVEMHCGLVSGQMTLLKLRKHD